MKVNPVGFTRMPGKLVVRHEIAYTSSTRRHCCLDSPHLDFARGRTSSLNPNPNTVATSHFLYNIIGARTTRHRFVYVRGQYALLP